MKKIPELIQRILTAIPLVGIVVAATFYVQDIPFVIANTLFMLLLGMEWIRLCGYNNLFIYLFYNFLLAIGCLIITSIPTQWIMAFSICMSAALVTYVGFSIYQKQVFKLETRMLIILGGIYLVLNWHALLLLKHSSRLLGIGFLIVILADTLAYLVGKYSGVHLIMPAISPRKTWEGFLAGWLGPIIVIMLANRCAGSPFQIDTPITVLIGLTTLVATAGDLFESIVKRQFSVKNSGYSLPGHGGWLDRCDSLVCAMPFFLAALFYIAKLFSL